jgi:hypothetical protein
MRKRKLYVSYAHQNSTGGGFGSIEFTITGPLDSYRVQEMRREIERNNNTSCIILAWSEMDLDPVGGEGRA